MASSTLLLADDSVTIQKVVNLTFSGEGVEVESVSDGNSALDSLRESPPDLVMADVNIPGVNGYEICEKVKSMDLGRDIPVILLVGSFEPFDEEEAKRVGADAHITKPFESIAALVDLVNGFLRGEEIQEQPRFDDTVEYPSDHEMVISASSIPFAGGFEDETIETEQVGSQDQEEVRSEEPVFEPVDGFDEDPKEAENIGAAAPGGFESEVSPPEVVSEQFAGDEPVAADDQPSQYYSDNFSADDDQAEFGDSGSEGEPRSLDEASAGYGEYKEPIIERFHGDDEPIEAVPIESESEQFESPQPRIEETEPEPETEWNSYDAATEDGDGEDTASEYQEPQDTEYSEAAEDRSFAPIPLGPSDSPSESEELGNMTVELDESELLELPVDLTSQASETEDRHFHTAETEHQAEQQEHEYAEHSIRDKFETTDLSEEPEPVSEAPFQAASDLQNYEEPAPPAEATIPDEIVEEIARRVVERLSEKAVREIAWEVVPEMAELIIKKMTEQKLNE